jgi:predicted nucleic acid-binding protein
MTALDTNVLIYSCDKANPRRQRQAIDLIASTEDGVLLWQVACEFVAACLECGVRRLYSEDLPGRRAPEPLEILNPFE